MHSVVVADHWGYPCLRQDDETTIARHDIAALYAGWRQRWNHSLVRSFQVELEHAGASEIALQLKLRHFDAPAVVLEDILRDVVTVLGKQAGCSYVSLVDSTTGSHLGACLVQDGVSNRETVSWSNEPVRFVDRLAFGSSAPKVPLRSIAEEVAAVMGNKYLDCSDARNAGKIYPERVRGLARIGFSLVIGSLLFAVVLFFIDSAPAVLMAAPAFSLAAGIFALQSALNKVSKAQYKPRRG